MTLLEYFRTNRSTLARNTFALLAFVWVSLAVQPCAMAFDLISDDDMHSSMSMHSTMSGNQDHPCDHCPDEPVSNDCQFDDWGSPNQAHNIYLDFKPSLLLEKVIAVISIKDYKPADLTAMHRSDSTDADYTYTPTQKQDILLC